MKYKYDGVTKSRENVSGVVEATDEAEAMLRLRAQQIRPLRLVKVKEGGMFGGGGKKSSFTLFKPIDLKGMVVFTRQFSSLVDSGVAIVQALDILYQQEARPP